ncbi:hypothetical protein Acy02nite_74650 [Actinoplanes cyaneus]|uniref:DUF3817 domain-containing protein n=1 Tax=Actinoplanes cyaneus TaxID=52696 RepID=A0A919IP65_9ACTN|nr:DUF3817 domain-containing protein [Actinoplanes cyaneus]MCW2142982.1 hypothetical protein [Actinoplanes cyaneus]GID69584.1 hypothetical protein Acy02nite_74650 [Actinoplanes cyaneus]
MNRPLRIAAAVELLSLLVLVINLATVHVAPVASLCGPVHGCAYLMIVILTAWHPAADRTAKLLAWVPGVGGLLATRRMNGRLTGERAAHRMKRD